ncbi:diguanylate cyclase [Marichromatium gracile]|uniref:diguanylate cyclase n=1 Tax=Marichromatium gracile TaxID=1048 RepID=A0ABR5VLI0_MARGR|nr:sensor domain-containing diguanylate cyclase [Marichromatium gracile]KXX66427.1 hypothetical protein AY586_00470 [Marichromatium gracile]
MSGRGFWRLYLPLALGLVALLVLVWGWSVRQMHRELDETARAGVDELVRLIENKLDHVAIDTLTLARQHIVQRYLDTGDRAWLPLIAAELANRIHYARRYQKIRLIDETGHEVVRVESLAGEILTIPEEELQDKADRYYVEATLGLEPGELYVSPLDLSIENGEVLLPFLPLLRVGTPVFDSAGRGRGMIVISYRAGHLLERLEDFGRAGPIRPMLINCAGYWLLAPQREMAWGFMVEGRAEQRMQVRYPEAWARMQHHPLGLIRTADGTFAYRDVVPLQSSYPVYSALCARRDDSVSPNLLRWHVAAFIARERYARAALTPTLVIAGLGVLLLVVLAFAVRATVALRADRRARFERLRRQARTDALTGLANRIAFEERTEIEIGRAARHHRRFALCLLDLDGFKAVNDSQGHLVGDEVLRFVAGILGRYLRTGSDDLASRFGGDEFGLLLCELTEVEQAQTILAELCRRISAADWGGQGVTVSIGVAFYPEHATHRTGLLRAADVAMYRAKASGKNRVVLAGAHDLGASAR